MIPALINRGIGFNVGIKYEFTLGLSIGAALKLTPSIIFVEAPRTLVFTQQV